MIPSLSSCRRSRLSPPLDYLTPKQLLWPAPQPALVGSGPLTTCTTVMAIEKHQETVSPIGEVFFRGLIVGHGMSLANLLKCPDVAKPSVFLNCKIRRRTFLVGDSRRLCII
jgi:hypothetical protein